jgi:beta-glucosidase
VAMERALSEGVPLKGYLHWSLLDNFEWENGWWPKFGLVEVDTQHAMKRTVRPSAKWFAERIEKLSSSE